ncbi:lytic murein transglycosylase [Methylobacillus flagellatus]|uniref:lytic murein transglycosylase n=1 Tax=Methylobacillus flagellatus TaxID=405 RepID=UPI001485AC45|nr:lytic murein transglycosylase [Methylobacillus flagellatus]
MQPTSFIKAFFARPAGSGWRASTGLAWLLATLIAGLATATPAQAQTGFAAWLDELRIEALAKGISAATFDAALANVSPDANIVAQDRNQPEFVQPFLSYLSKRVTDNRVSNGQALRQRHQALLDDVELAYGVPSSVLLAFWGLETNYGQFMGSHAIPAALATLAYDGRRHQFFRSQLLDALRIIEQGHIEASGMRGSWAGAMGHMQFIPSTFLTYAVDGDQDGHIDVWSSLPDAFYSAANYLSQMGWQGTQPTAVEVWLPERFDWQQAALHLRQPARNWLAMGVLPVEPLRQDSLDAPAAVILPQGAKGPAFLVFDNFDIVMRWNRSVNYALSVALLSERIIGGPDLMRGYESAHDALSHEALKQLQQQLNLLGFEAGEPDGFPGPQTQAAIRRYQLSVGLSADGYASPALLTSLLAQPLQAQGR